jgi:hypothetical protein
MVEAWRPALQTLVIMIPSLSAAGLLDAFLAFSYKGIEVKQKVTSTLFNQTAKNVFDLNGKCWNSLKV